MSKWIAAFGGSIASDAASRLSILPADRHGPGVSLQRSAARAVVWQAPSGAQTSTSTVLVAPFNQKFSFLLLFLWDDSEFALFRAGNGGAQPLGGGKGRLDDAGVAFLTACPAPSVPWLAGTRVATGVSRYDLLRWGSRCDQTGRHRAALQGFR